MSSVTTTLILLLSLSVLAYVISTFIHLLIKQARSPLRDLQGPPPGSFFMGNLPEMHDQENTDLVARWERLYGTTFVYRGFIGGYRLMTTDPVAVAHIMGHAYDYPKPDFVRDNLASMAAGKEGLLTVEGEDHRRQRKILAPAFSATHIKLLSPIFWDKAVQLREIWLNISSGMLPEYTQFSPSSASPSDPFSEPAQAVQDDKSTETSATRVSSLTTSFLPNPFVSFKPSKAIWRRTNRSSPSFSLPSQSTAEVSLGRHARSRVNVLAWLARATLDVIGEAGFGYQFNSLYAATQSLSQESELARAFGVIFASARKFRVITVLQVWFPILLQFRKDSAAMKEAQDTMHRIGLALIAERQAEVAEEQSGTGSPFEAKLASNIEGDKTLEGRDLLSVLIRSNLSSVSSQRLSMNETLCQISTFISAGHETTSAALSWTLYALARALDIQTTLRAHLRSIARDPFALASPPSELLDAVLRHPYLDHVVRESLRLHAPVTSTMRVAGADDVIPVSRPFRDRHGRECAAIHVKKGDIITVPIQAMNKSKEVWGEDAAVFRPERWTEDVDGERWREDHAKAKRERVQRKAGVPGLWGNMLTFGNGNPINGHRACIGYRFAINEIKMFLFVLLRDIEFSIDPSIEIEKKVNVVTRPMVKSEPHIGNQMPLYLRHIPSDTDISTTDGSAIWSTEV